MVKKIDNERGFNFPKDTEIFKCREGRKEFIRERPEKRQAKSQYKLVAEFPLNDNYEEQDARMIWRMAKQTARDFLRNSWLEAAIVTHIRKDAYGREIIAVYGKLTMSI